ncbi:MAG: AAA family ATPase [Bacteroidales bacterium]
MENVLLKYMDERFDKPEETGFCKVPGPVITISRVCGCSATRIAEQLSIKINKILVAKGFQEEWKWVNKEILSMVSNELKISPKKVKQLVESQQKNVIQEIVSSFTENYYAHSTKVKNAIQRAVRHIAIGGNVVIVGRAGGIITSDIVRSLHINLEAPLSWRAASVSAKHSLSIEDSKKYIVQMDYQRDSFKELFKKKNSEAPDYDLTINCKSHSIDQICEIIIKEAQMRNLL